MRLRAYVKSSTGIVKHTIGEIEGVEFKKTSDIPLAEWVEISDQEDGVYLFHYNENGECIADTWHLNVEEAKTQATFEFEIDEADWKEVE